MKCTEVIEWMHRYLDHDLSIEEISEMFRHIDDCLPCAEIFDRLTTLSQQLEQLPDVKPPFSLVDSILPRLDELDRSLLASDKGETAEQVVVPFSRESVQGKRQRGSSMGRRTGIGAVAAALILGIAIFNMPKEMPDAQVDNMLSKSAQEVGTNAGANSKMNDSSADTAATADTGDAPAGGSGGNNTSGSAMVQADIAEQSPVPSMNAKEVVGPSAGAAESTKPTAEGTSTWETSDVKPTKRPKHESTAAPESSDLRSSTLAATEEPSAAEDKNDAQMESDILKSMKIPEVSNDQGIMGLIPPSNDSGELSWTSADGQYAAVVEGQQLIIYNIPPTGIGVEKLPLTSIPLVGKWVTGEWNANSAEFRYVTDNNGKLIENVYVVPDAGTPSQAPATGTTSTK